MSAHGQRVQIINVRPHRRVSPSHLLVLRVDQEVLVRRVRAHAVTQPEVTRGQLQRLAGEHVAWPRAAAARP